MSSGSALANPATWTAPAVWCNLQHLRVLEIEWNSGAKPNIAVLDAPLKRVHEDVEVTPGQTEITIWTQFRRGSRGELETFYLFRGKIWNVVRQIGPEGETYRFIAYDARKDFDAWPVYGRMVQARDSSVLRWDGAEIIFNEEYEGRPIGNRASGAGGFANLFSTDPRSLSALWWTAQEAIYHLFEVYLPASLKAQVPMPSYAPTGLTDPSGNALIIHDLNLQGKGVASAWDLIFQKIGARWWFRPTATGFQWMYFWAMDEATNPVKTVYAADVQVGCPPNSPDPDRLYRYYDENGDYQEKYGQDLIDAGKAFQALERINTTPMRSHSWEIAEDHSKRINHYIGIANPKLYEATFNLIRGWPVSLEDALRVLGADEMIRRTRKTTEEDEGATDAEWELYKNVGRLWILNETGTEVPGESGTPYDFSALIGNHINRPRLFKSHRLTKDSKGNYERPKVLFLDSEDSQWKEFEGSIRLLHERAGIYIEGGTLDDLPFFDYTALTFPTNLRILAAIESDAVLEYSYPASLPNPFYGGAVLNLGRKYLWDSINMSDAQYSTDRLEDYVYQQWEKSQAEKRACVIRFPYVEMGFTIGDLISKIRGREITFPSGRYPQVVSIRFDVEHFETELRLEDQRFETTR